MELVPETGLVPAVVVFQFMVVAIMRLPLLLGREWMAFFVKAFWNTRIEVDQIQALQADYKMAQELGKVQIVSALIKEAALSLTWHFRLFEDGQANHALGEIALQALRKHPDLIFQVSHSSAWGNPFAAWYALRHRCAALRVSLEWCHNMALELSPQPPASSLFEDEHTLNARLVEALKSPFIRPRN